MICYLTVLLQRVFQFKVLENKYSSSELNEFYKEFQLVEGEDSCTNISIGSNFITELSDMTGLPLENYFLSTTKLKKVLNYRFQSVVLHHFLMFNSKVKYIFSFCAVFYYFLFPILCIL